jgi:hypothetical protein
VYLRKNGDGSLEAVEHRLIGIASNEEPPERPTRIICQGPARLHAMLEFLNGTLNGALE